MRRSPGAREISRAQPFVLSYRLYDRIGQETCLSGPLTTMPLTCSPALGVCRMFSRILHELALLTLHLLTHTPAASPTGQHSPLHKQIHNNPPLLPTGIITLFSALREGCYPPIFYKVVDNLWITFGYVLRKEEREIL